MGETGGVQEKLQSQFQLPHRLIIHNHIHNCRRLQMKSWLQQVQLTKFSWISRLSLGALALQNSWSSCEVSTTRLKMSKPHDNKTELWQTNLILHISSGHRCAPGEFLMSLVLSVHYNKHKQHIHSSREVTLCVSFTLNTYCLAKWFFNGHETVSVFYYEEVVRPWMEEDWKFSFVLRHGRWSRPFLHITAASQQSLFKTLPHCTVSQL